MDDTPTSTPGPRRSQRERKTVKPFRNKTASTRRKRKTAETDAEDNDEREVTGQGGQENEAQEGDDTDHEEPEEEEEEENEIYKSTKQKRKRGKNARSKTKDVPPAKRRRTTQTEDEGGHTSGGEEADASGNEDEEQGGTKAPTKGGKRGRAQVSPKAKSKRTRKSKGTGAPTKPTKLTGRRRRVKEGGGVYDAEQVARETKISADNPLFNAIVDPATSLQQVVEDFVQSLSESPEIAQAELINLILRSCGCNDSVDSNQVIDYDGVLDALDNFTEVLKQENSPIYPLTSKLPIFKKFRKSLSEFIDRLISSVAELGMLYSSDLVATLQAWVIAMSSSQIRSFRHTATVMALEVETALCDVAAGVDKEAEVVSRQREGEKKRRGAGKGLSAREKELEAKAKEIRERKTKLAEYLKEFVDGVFVHRYRDLDPNIRAECVKAIGQWFSKYPNHFLDASYLRYVGWVLSDTNTHVRLEAVKALGPVYEKEEYVGSLTHFTERFKPRLLEMATSDVELSIRVAVIQVLEEIDGQALLDEDEREKLCLLIFDEEVKVRKAVGGFVRRAWKEGVEERSMLAGKGKGKGKAKGRKKDNDGVSEKNEERIGLKVLVSLFERWGKLSAEAAGDEGEESENGDYVLVAARANGRDRSEESSVDGPSRRVSRKKEVLAVVGTGMNKKGRVTLAVEALWDDLEIVKDWEDILDMLSLDHSTNASSQQHQNGRVNGKERTPPLEAESIVQDAWRLEEGEETILLEILVASARQTKVEAVGAKKGEEEIVANDITREFIKVLPRFFIKYQTDQNRIVNVLQIPTLMNVDLYLEMRMISAYNSLWDDIIKQYMSHSSVTVLRQAIVAIQYLMKATSLSNSNSTKILELEDELASALRDTIGGRDEVEVTTLAEDEVLALEAHCLRIGVLFGMRNLTAWMEEDEGGKQSCAWDIVSALVERGRLGYKEEENMVEQALHVLTLHILWKSKDVPKFLPGQELTPEEERQREVLKEQRNSLTEKLLEFAIGTQSNTAEGVKRASFKYLLDLYVLFAPRQGFTAEDSDVSITDPLSLTLDDETQYRCAGYVQAEIERFSELLEDDYGDDPSSKRGSEEDLTSEDGGDVGGEQSTSKSKEKAKKGDVKNKEKRKEVDMESRSWLEREYLFIDVISTFLRAIRAGTINVYHGSVLLAHYGRLSAAFDTCVKVLVDVLREEGLLADNPEVIVTVVTNAIQECFTLTLDGYIEDEQKAIQLAKLLSSCYVIRGSQLSIVKRLESQAIVRIQMNLLSWVVKRLAAYQSNKNKKGLRKCLLFFRILVPLLSMIQNRDALKIKAHMGQIFDQAKVQVSPTLKAWEPQRQYEKRLNNIMNKDKATEGRRRKADRGTVSAGEFSSGGEESDAGRLGDTDGEQEHLQAGPRRSGLRRTRAKPNPRKTQEQDRDTNEEDQQRDETLATSKADRSQTQREIDHTTTPTEHRSRSHFNEIPTFPAHAPELGDGEEHKLTNNEQSNETIAHGVSAETTVTPKATKTKKRVRNEDEFMEIQDNAGADITPRDTSPASDPSQRPRSSSPVEDFHVRRKRVRL